MEVSEIIFLVLAIIMAIIMGYIVFRADKKFHDKTKDIRIGMSEDNVMEIIEKDPSSINELKDGNYSWIYESRTNGRWGIEIHKTEIMFDVNHIVISINRNKYLERLENK